MPIFLCFFFVLFCFFLQCRLQLPMRASRKKKRKKRKERRKERKEKKRKKKKWAELVLGRLGFGPSWFKMWAELVLGRVGIGPTWFWAELTRERLYK